MPRDPAGNFTLVPGYRAEAGQTIRTEQHNPPLEDIASSLTNSLSRDGRGGMVGPIDMGTFPIRNVGRGEAETDVATIGQGLPLGAVIDYAGSVAPAGWFFCDGRAISRTFYPGLFDVLRLTYGAGDGSTTFNLPDLRGRVAAAPDNMGGTDAGRISPTFGAVARTVGGAFGTASQVLTLAQSPAHNHGGSTGIAGVHNHGGNTTAAGSHVHAGRTDVRGDHFHGVGTTASAASGGNLPAVIFQLDNPIDTSIAGAHQHALSIDAAGEHTHGIPQDGNHLHTIATQGGNEPHPNVQPTMVLNKIIKAVP